MNEQGVREKNPLVTSMAAPSLDITGSSRPQSRKLWLILSSLVNISAFMVTCSCAQPWKKAEANQRALPAGENQQKMALFPFENYSDDREAPRDLMPLIRETLKAKGIQLVSEDDTELFLREKRIRYTGSVTRKDAQEFGGRVEAQYIIVGFISLYVKESDKPQVGLSGRLISTRTGSIVGATTIGATGQDFTTILNRGTIYEAKPLCQVVVEQFITEFLQWLPEPQAVGKIPALHRVADKGSTYYYRKKGFQLDTIKRIAVLPFVNSTPRTEAGIIISNLIIGELFEQYGIEATEPVELMEALIEMNVKYIGLLSLPDMKTLSSLLGVQAIMVGNIDTYEEGYRIGEKETPEVEIYARLLDANTGQILWIAVGQHLGDDSIFIFDIGRVRSITSLSKKTISEMMATLRN